MRNITRTGRSRRASATTTVVELRSNDALKPIFAMVGSGGLDSETWIHQLSGIPGPLARPDGKIIETPAPGDFLEGLNVREYTISSQEARKSTFCTALKTSDPVYESRT